MQFDEKQKKMIKELAETYTLALLVLFGSRAKGRATSKSDFDIGYRSKAKLDLEDESRLALDLSKIVQSEHIDLVDISKTSPLLKYAIFRDAILLYEAEPLTFPSYAAYAFKQYVEAKPLLRAMEKRVFEKIKKYDI